MNESEELALEGISHFKRNNLIDNYLELSWKNVCVYRSKKSSTSSFWMRSNYKEVQILNDVNGQVKSGDLLAIMGPSGSGKTTLLASISMRIRQNFSGSILLNGRCVSTRHLANISGFVPQQDLAFEMLTVTEHMQFMTKMKMSKFATSTIREQRIEHLLNALGLNKCRSTKLHSLSGGERKRLSLAVQLINDPPLLFCDEPTTGLDSSTAASVINQLRELSSQGKAIVCSIHQPASGIIDLFHQVLLLTGGRVAFHGPVIRATAFFRLQGFTSPPGYNEAEFLVSAISDDDHADKICSAWECSDQNEYVWKNDNSWITKNQQSNISTWDKIKKNRKNIVDLHRENPGIFTQLIWLTWRSFLCSKRNYKIGLADLLALMGIAIVVALPYTGIMTKTNQEDVQSVQGLMYLIVTEVIFIFAYSVFTTFPPEIAVLLRELANQLYTPGPYYVSKVILMIPKAIAVTFLYTTIIFWIVGMDDELFSWITFSVPVIFAANCANAYGAWLSASFESIETASIFSVPFELISYTFSGTFLNLATAQLYWLKYISIFYYSIEAISILQWKKVTTISCNIEDVSSCVKTGAEVIDYLGFNVDNYKFDLIGMVVIYFVFHFLGYLSICRRSKRQPVY